jgi:hypothetical protein
MKAEQLQLALRPRPMYEAADLGVRMAQDGFASLRRAYLPFGLILVLACGSTVELASWLPSTLLWWLKPWLDRTLLQVYARQVFGESTGFAQAWAARARTPWPDALRMLTIGRLSFWRAYSMPVAQLEGQSGAARRQRLQAILRGHRGAATMVQGVFSWVEAFLWLALLSLAAWLTPGLRSFDSLKEMFDGGLASDLGLYGAYAVAVLFVEPFFVASGFAMYLNRRVELEAWDVEQELRHAFEAP